MPESPPHPCTYPGCRCLVRGASARCSQHQAQTRQAVDAARGSAASRGYDSAWRKASAAYLREHPRCEDCRDRARVTAATCVDHVVPFRVNGVTNWRLKWDRNNWRASCAPCHSAKTARADGGFGNARRVAVDT